jgi:FkbM family methyltransferase
MAVIQMTPFRQLAKLYGSVLSINDSLSTIARAKSECVQNATPAQIIDPTPALIEAMRPQKENIDLYDRLDLRLLLDKSSLVDKAIIENGAWEPEQMSFFFGTMGNFLGEANTVFLDVGAYWGLYSLLARRAGINRIFAFEPDRCNFSQLQTQLFLNNATGDVTPVNKAISEKRQTVHFWDSRTHPSGNRAGGAVVSANFHRPTYEVEAISLDEMFDFREHFVWIKLDVEGHEANALRGMKRLIEDNQVLLQIEVFDIHKEIILPEIEKLGLRKVHAIYPDQYYTNMTDSRLPF